MRSKIPSPVKNSLGMVYRTCRVPRDFRVAGDDCTILLCGFRSYGKIIDQEPTARAGRAARSQRFSRGCATEAARGRVCCARDSKIAKIHVRSFPPSIWVSRLVVDYLTTGLASVLGSAVKRSVWAERAGHAPRRRVRMEARHRNAVVRDGEEGLHHRRIITSASGVSHMS